MKRKENGCSTTQSSNDQLRVGNYWLCLTKTRHHTNIWSSLSIWNKNTAHVTCRMPESSLRGVKINSCVFYNMNKLVLNLSGCIKGRQINPQQLKYIKLIKPHCYQHVNLIAPIVNTRFCYWGVKQQSPLPSIFLEWRTD